MIPLRDIPRTIWIHVILIMVCGLLALYSASYNNVRVEQDIFYEQLWGVVVGLGIMGVLSCIDYRKFLDIAYIFYALSVFLLFLVLIFGRQALGATRWFSIGGISFQPSEVSKLAVILFLACYFSQRRPRLSFDMRSSFYGLWEDLIAPLLLTLLSIGLIFKQPDLGTAILIAGIFVLMLYVSGIEGRIFWGFLGLCFVAMPFAWHILKPYQKDRLMVFLNPNIDPLGAGYTIIQSKIAVGSGGIFGKGWLSGTQNQLNFLPERHTDFIFSVIGEEWGLAGGLFLLYCYSVIIYCAFKIAEHNKDKFGSLAAIGIAGILALQVIINIGMVLGLCPVVGITLPLVSYGRTSYIIFVVMLGILLNLSKKRMVF